MREALLQRALDTLPLRLELYGPQMREDALSAVRELIESPLNGLELQPSPYPRSPSTLPPLREGTPRLVGVLGAVRSGKDTLAELAQAEYANVARIAYSDTILPEVNQYLSPLGYHVDHHCKTLPHFRHLLQAWGSGRRLEDPDYWIRTLHAMIRQEWEQGARLVLVPGLRLVTNPDTGAVSWRDVEAIQELGGEAWVVHRPNNPQAGHAHHNESALSQFGPEDFDQWVLNPAGLEEFQANIRAVLRGKPQPYP